MVKKSQNQAQSSLIKPNRVIFYESKQQSREEPNGVVEWWSIGQVVKFSHPPLHHSIGQSRPIKPNQG
jgi:hypothetical protein